MDSSNHVRIAEPDENASGVRIPVTSISQQLLAPPLRQAILRTREWLLAEQHPDGYWRGELEGDTLLESEYILLMAFLGRQDSPLVQKAARHILDQQLANGGWAMYPGGRVEISNSVKNYFALKLTGHDPSAEYMQRARAAVLRHGGADAVNSFTRFYLAMLGQISYQQCPTVPPEITLFPKWFPVNLYAVSSWSRTIIVPLSIVSACQPVTQVAPEHGIRELFLTSPDTWELPRCPGLAGGTGLFSWDRFFRTVERCLKFSERWKLLPLRKRALAAAERWMTDRFKQSDGLGAIFPPIVWSMIALRCRGYADDSPEFAECDRQLHDLVIEEGQTARIEPCKSPVWDTAIAMKSLLESGVGAHHPKIERATTWLLDREIRQPGDWSETVDADPAGWCFEFNNVFYPDVDDTAMVAMSLRQRFEEVPDTNGSLPPGLHLVEEATASSLDQGRQKIAAFEQTLAAIRRADRWIAAMQNKDGGWGAFDKDNDRQFLCYVPFADHNAMIDPSTPDLTGRVLESLGRMGRRVGDPVVDRAVAYIRSTQEADGSWLGRWGVNYVYGTWLVLTGLTEVGVPTSDPAIVAGANWLLSYQQPCGGWGESCDSYDDPTLRGQGKVTASQTAWGVLGLLAAGLHDHPAVARGVRCLIDRQLPDGTWDEPEFTGTGFPRVFYLRYHLYRIYFPLSALSRWATKLGSRQDEADVASHLRVVSPPPLVHNVVG